VVAAPDLAAIESEVLDFWFGAPGSAERDGERPVWFHKDPEFDRLIRRRFAPHVERAFAGELDPMRETARGALALIVTLDQFPRNMFRDSPRAFAGDAKARVTAGHALALGFDRGLSAYERWFIYMPFQHSENPDDQRRAVELFTTLAAQYPADAALASALDFARRHHDVIGRFGRFPHRNAILGRASTAEEEEFLKQPGSSF